MAPPLLVVVALLCPRLGGRPGDSVSYDPETGEAVLVRRLTVAPELVQQALDSGHVIPVSDDGAPIAPRDPWPLPHQRQAVLRAS